MSRARWTIGSRYQPPHTQPCALHFLSLQVHDVTRSLDRWVTLEGQKRDLGAMHVSVPARSDAAAGAPMRLAWTWRLSSHQQLLKWAYHSLPSFKRAWLCSTPFLGAQVDEDREVLPAGFFDDLDPDREVRHTFLLHEKERDEKRGCAPGVCGIATWGPVLLRRTPMLPGGAPLVCWRLPPAAAPLVCWRLPFVSQNSVSPRLCLCCLALTLQDYEGFAGNYGPTLDRWAAVASRQRPATGAQWGEWVGGCLTRCGCALCCHVGWRLDRRNLYLGACMDGLGVDGKSLTLTCPAATTTIAARAVTRWASWPSASLTWLAARRLRQQTQLAQQQTQQLEQQAQQVKQRDKRLQRKRQQVQRQAEQRQRGPAGHLRHSWPTGSCAVCCRSGWM